MLKFQEFPNILWELFGNSLLKSILKNLLKGAYESADFMLLFILLKSKSNYNNLNYKLNKIIDKSNDFCYYNIKLLC